MRRGFCIWLAPVLMLTAVAIATAAEPEPGKQVACELTIKLGEGDEAVESTIHYWLFVPREYDAQDTWPLMVFLHGAGERGDDLEVVKKWGPPKRVAEKPDFPFVLVSPQCPRNVRWDPQLIAHLTDHVAGKLKIDKQRMYITGLSMGGFGTWALLAEYPKLYAAAVPICGGGDPAEAERMKQVPIWVFHGDQDPTVPVSRSQDMVDALKKVDGDVKLTVYPGVGHNSWSETYANPEVYKWLLSHKRK